MALPTGTPVTIDENEVASGSGLSLVLYESMKSFYLAAKPLPSLYPPPDWTSTTFAWQFQIKPVRLSILRSIAVDANGIAAAVGVRAFFTITTTSYTVTDSDDVLLADGTAAAGRIFITFPSAELWPGRVIVVKNLAMSGNGSNISLQVGDNIDGASAATLGSTDYQSWRYISDGASSWLSI